MTANEFVSALAEYIPDTDELRKNGYDDDEIELSIAEWRMPPVDDCEAIIDDALVELAECYETDMLDIGGIHIGCGVEETDQYYIVGDFNQHPFLLAVSKANKEVVVLNEEEGEILFRCAVHSLGFLDALARAADLIVNEQLNNTGAEECSQLAGGVKYSEFWSHVLAV